MNLFEYEGKQFFRRFSLPVPQSMLLTDAEQPAPLPFPFVLKAQVLTGGRGKAGGVQVCHDQAAYAEQARRILAMEIKGHRVHGLLAEEMVQPEREFYLSITLQGVQRPTLIFSPQGGMEIENVAATQPDQILRLEIDPFLRLKGYQKKRLAQWMGLPQPEVDAFLEKLQRAFFEGGATLVEINPLGVVDGKLVAMDAKLVLDDHNRAAKAFEAELEEARSALWQYTPPAHEATTVTYVPLQGDVGLISDGAGTGMLTLDLLTDLGLDVACFTELGGMTSEEVMYRAMELTLGSGRPLKAVLIVLIGGFNRMDNMARGILRYVREHQVTVPIFTRMCGTMEEEGLALMREAGMKTYYDLTETAQALCRQVKEG